jgi:hypothetical protein
MSLVLQLPPALESKLATEAARLQLPLAEYAVRLLAGTGGSDARPRNGAELIAYWKKAGVIGMRPDIDDARVHARALRKRAEKRAR